MRKKKILKCCLITVISVAVVFSIVLAHYFLTTRSAQGCIDYCIENSQRGATVFTRVGDPRYTKQYAYFIAANGDSSKPQEIFVFRQKFFGSVSAFDRYEFVMSSTQATGVSNSENSFGSVQFFARDDHDETETRSTLMFFGALNDSDITECEYTLTVREGTLTYKDTVTKNDSIWFIRFFELGNVSDYTKKNISDIKFYDSNGNLVAEY